MAKAIHIRYAAATFVSGSDKTWSEPSTMGYMPFEP